MLIDTDFFYVFWFILFILLFVWKKIIYKKNLSFLFFILYTYIILLIGVTFFPIPINIPNPVADSYKNMYIPFQSISEILSKEYLPVYQKIRQIWWNLILLFPLWFLLPYVLTKYHWKKIILIIFCVSLGIEIGQAFVSEFIVWYKYRTFDVDDIWLNTIGGIIGYVCFVVYDRYIFPTQQKGKL